MKAFTSVLLLVICSLFVNSQAVLAQDCPLAHTHIGVNPTWRPADWSSPGVGALDPDPTDDLQLWLFSIPPVHPCATPGWPNWSQVDGSPFLLLSPVLEEEQPIVKPDDPNKTLYTCNFTYTREGGYGDEKGLHFLEGWHSAHGPQRAWNLESVDANTVPAWDIAIQRVRVSANLEGDDFFCLRSDDTDTLVADGESALLTKHWLNDKQAWGLHENMGFYFWLDESDEEVSVTLYVYDQGGLYLRSADTVFRFAKHVCVPIAGDTNGDCVVDIHDLEIVVENFGKTGIVHGEDAGHGDHDHDHDDH